MNNFAEFELTDSHIRNRVVIMSGLRMKTAHFQNSTFLWPIAWVLVGIWLVCYSKSPWSLREIPELRFFSRQIMRGELGKRLSLTDVPLQIVVCQIGPRKIIIVWSHEDAGDGLVKDLRIDRTKTHCLESIFGKDPPLGRRFRGKARCKWSRTSAFTWFGWRAQCRLVILW